MASECRQGKLDWKKMCKEAESTIAQQAEEIGRLQARAEAALMLACEELVNFVDCPGEVKEEVGDFCDEDACMNDIRAECWASYFKEQVRLEQAREELANDQR